LNVLRAVASRAFFGFYFDDFNAEFARHTLDVFTARRFYPSGHFVANADDA
jgi:hypothetical protein